MNARLLQKARRLLAYCRQLGLPARLVGDEYPEEVIWCHFEFDERVGRMAWVRYSLQYNVFFFFYRDSVAFSSVVALSESALQAQLNQNAAALHAEEQTP